MGQVAFDTLQASEELETAGISREHAKAISLVVRKSHEVADVATKADIADVKRDIADVRKDMEARFEKNEAQMQARFEKHEAQMQACFEKTDAQIADVRKDLSAEIADVRKDLSTEIADVRKDIAQIDKRLDFSEKRFDRLEIKFDRLQWFLLAGILSLLLKDLIPKLWGG